jgi:hypothetical protein
MNACPTFQSLGGAVLFLSGPTCNPLFNCTSLEFMFTLLSLIPVTFPVSEFPVPSALTGECSWCRYLVILNGVIFEPQPYTTTAITAINVARSFS